MVKISQTATKQSYLKWRSSVDCHVQISWLKITFGEEKWLSFMRNCFIWIACLYFGKGISENSSPLTIPPWSYLIPGRKYQACLPKNWEMDNRLFFCRIRLMLERKPAKLTRVMMRKNSVHGHIPITFSLSTYHSKLPSNNNLFHSLPKTRINSWAATTSRQGRRWWL